MSVKSLAQFIENRCKELKISPRKASLKAVNSPDFIRHMKTAKNAPKTDKLLALAKVLSLDLSELTAHIEGYEDAFFGNAIPYQSDILGQIEVLGSVQAGIFTEALEWDAAKRYHIQIPIDDGYPKETPRYALEVKGESMNRVFPHGSLVSVIDFEVLERPPETGDYVVVMRRDTYGPGFEATIKALQIRDDGSVCLWPQSTDPGFQQPFVLPAPDYDVPACAGCPDIQIKGLVVSSIKTRLKATF